MYKRERPIPLPLREPTIPQRRKSPSFSSSLLDAIYRSIDEPSPLEDKDSGFYANAPRIKKQSSSGSHRQGRPGPSSSSCSCPSPLHRAILIEEWMETQSNLHCNLSLNSASISSSSESSSGATFSSSSEAEYSRRSSKSRPKQHHFGYEPRRPDSRKKVLRQGDDEGNNGVAGGFTKTKLRALKIYSELKSLKQPISPGGRISSFLNSIFNSGNVKKAKMCYVGAVEDVSFERKSKSACSSASSLSRRSCMTKAQKTPNSCTSSASSSFPGRNKTARSVRFYPVSEIVGEDARPCGHKPVHEEDPALIVPMPATSRGRRGQDAIKKGSTSSVARDRGFRARLEDYVNEEEEDDEDEDAESCASSELFELDHLTGIGRYREELPVYETTCLKMNRAIASGMKL